MKAIDKQLLGRNLLNLILIMFLIGQIGCSNQNNESSADDLSVSDHFDPKGKGPSKHTLDVWENWKKAPFLLMISEILKKQQKGFIAAPDFQTNQK
jgi:hypothetical protein